MTAAVVLYAGARTSHPVLAPLLAELRTLAAGTGVAVQAYVLHSGLEPGVVDDVRAADPGARFLRAAVEHHQQFEVEPTHLQRLRALDAVGLAGFERVLVAPATPGVLDLLGPALTTPLGTPPDAAWTTDLAAPDNRVLLLAGHRCGPAALAEVDLALATREAASAPWAVLRGPGVLARPAEVTDVPAPAAAAAPDVDAALAGARLASDDTDFARARAILAAAYPTAGDRSPEVLLALARALRALSDEDGAAAVLGLVRDRHGEDHAVLAQAETQLAELAWVRHDLRSGEQHAIAALRANPSARRAALVRDRCREPEPVRTSGALAHVAFYPEPGGNVGDVLLPGAVRSAVADACGEPPAWLPVHAHQVFDRSRLGDVAGVVVGGGGLFLPDTAPNGRSGWQWNVATDDLAALDVPLAVVAVGWNLFPGQEFRGSRFEQSLTALVDRAAVVGLRNQGSVRQVRSLLPDRLAERVTWLPCPTTVLGELRPAPQVDVRPDLVLLNAAYDRAARRFGAGYDEFLARLAAWVRALQGDGVEVRCAAHLPADERVAEDLLSTHGVRIGIDALWALDAEEVLRRFAQAALVVGMRGHATMIPFGLGTPVLSLVSHPKLRYFLEDLERPEWGVDVADEQLTARLLERSRDVLDRPRHYRDDVVALRRTLLDVVRSPLRDFAATLPSLAAR